MADERVWYLYTAEGQQGPFTAEEIRSWRDAGQITDEWNVWREGLAAWQPLGATPEIVAPAAPPPPPSAPAAPAAAAEKKVEPKKEGKVEKKKPAAAGRRISTGFLGVLLLILLLGGGAVGAMYLYPDLLDQALRAVGLAAPPPPPAPAVQIATAAGPPTLLADLPAGAAAGVNLKGAGAFIRRIEESEAWKRFLRSPAGSDVGDVLGGDSSLLAALDPLLAEEAAVAVYVEGESAAVLFAGRGEVSPDLEALLAKEEPGAPVPIGEAQALRFPYAADIGTTHVWLLEREGLVYLALQGEADSLLGRVVALEGGGDAIRTDAPYLEVGASLPDDALILGYIDGERAAPLARTLAGAGGLPPGIGLPQDFPAGVQAFSLRERDDGVEWIQALRAAGAPTAARPLKTIRKAPADGLQLYVAFVFDPAAEGTGAAGALPLPVPLPNLLADSAALRSLAGEGAVVAWSAKEGGDQRYAILLDAADEKGALDILEGAARGVTAAVAPSKTATFPGGEARIIERPGGKALALGAIGDGLVALASDIDALSALAGEGGTRLAEADRIPEMPAEVSVALLVDLAAVSRTAREYLRGIPLDKPTRAKAEGWLDLLAAAGEIRGYVVPEGDVLKTTLRFLVSDSSPPPADR